MDRRLSQVRRLVPLRLLVFLEPQSHEKKSWPARELMPNLSMNAFSKRPRRFITRVYVEKRECLMMSHKITKYPWMYHSLTFSRSHSSFCVWQEQDETINAIQAELTKAEAELRDANERELPEESYRVVVEAKRKELHDLMEQYAAENKRESTNESAAEQRKHYERPSERRKRLEEKRHDHDVGDNRHDDHEQQDAFQHFGGRNKHHGSDRSSGYH